MAEALAKRLGSVPADERAIPVHQLLRLTSGLAVSLGGAFEPLSRDEMVVGALDSALVSAPGDEPLYSNAGYSVLGAIIEEASDMSSAESPSPKICSRWSG